MKVTDSDLAIALEVAQRFASSRGLRAEFIDHWVKYVEIRDENTAPYRQLLMYARPKGKVLLGAVATVKDPGKMWMSLSKTLGTYSSQALREAPLWQGLEEGWRWVTSLDADTVRRIDAARREHVRVHILPIVLRFASERNLEVRAKYDEHCVLGWPPGKAEFILQVNYSPAGIGFGAYRRVKRGLLRRPAWLACEGFLDDLAITDWIRTEELSHRLGVAHERTNRCVPPAGSMECWFE